MTSAAPGLEAHAYLPYVRSAVAAFDAVLATGDLDAAVPACPGWDLRRLTWHLGDVHRWARTAIVEGRGDRETPDGPHERNPLREWFSDGAQALLATLAGTDPAAPAWSFGEKPRTAAFWFRRQAQESTMHAYDAQASQGAPAPIEAALALDGIDEVVRFFFPRQVRLGRMPALTRSLALVPDGVADPDETDGASWVLAGDGLDGERPAGTDADATVRAPAQALLLLLWQRLDLADAGLRLTGDEAAAHAVLGARLTP